MRLWREILESDTLEDAASIEILLLACEALGRAEILKGEIKKDGAVLRSETSRMVRDHPAIKHELANRAFVAKQLRELGLIHADVRRGIGPADVGRGNLCRLVTNAHLHASVTVRSEKAARRFLKRHATPRGR